MMANGGIKHHESLFSARLDNHFNWAGRGPGNGPSVGLSQGFEGRQARWEPGMESSNPHDELGILLLRRAAEGTLYIVTRN
jgi:hypothetical protein